MPHVLPTGPGARLSATTARSILRWAAVGVTAYVLSWFVAGLLIEDYDPLRQAISETFAIGAPTGPRLLVTVSLIATGVLLVAFGPAMDRLAPGTGWLAPALAMVSGVATVLVAAAPCTNGCPGFGTTPIDTLHVVFAAIGYLTLIACPLAFAARVAPHEPRAARVSAVLGATALALFLVSNVVVQVEWHGLLQRTYNTLADVWYVGAAWWLTRRSSGGVGPTGSEPSRAPAA